MKRRAGDRMPRADRGVKWGNAALVLGAILFSLLAGELVARIADGRGIFREPMYFGTPQIVPIEKYIAKIEAGRKGVGELWKLSPPPLPNRGTPTKEDIERLREFGDPLDLGPTLQLRASELFKVWNSKLEKGACDHPVLKHLTRWPLDFFDPPGGDDRPRYRYRQNATLPTGLVTNQMGWRGKPVEALTPQTIRIVFVGASTIAEAPDLPWSAPELLDAWLNEWARERGLAVRFEVLNAGREGSSTSDVAAIVRDEVAPLRPDLVIFYEGAISFDWSSVVENAAALKELPRPQYEDFTGWVTTAARMSSLFARLLAALGEAGISMGFVEEGPKPPYEIAWPKGLDESDPDIGRKDLPLNLTGILKDFDTMRVALDKVGSEFALSSFAWLARDGLKVDPVKGRYIWTSNNQSFWPWTYHDIRRGLDFEMRVYRKFTEAHGLPFLDVARLIPGEPLLFADAVHMTTSGIRVKAWAFFRELLPVIEKRLADGTWPRHLQDRPLPKYEFRRQLVACSEHQ
jgi:hypothetical protein